MPAAHGCEAVRLRSSCVASPSVALIAIVILCTPATAQDSAHDAAAETSTAPSLGGEIDRLTEPALPQILASQEQDGLLLRRLSLDLRGVVPTREELDEFAADHQDQRWEKWVDRFLVDPLCDEHLVTFLDRTLMLRRGHSQVDRASWINYLRDQVSVDRPLDELSHELLYTPWWNRDQRPAQRFYLDRGGDPHLITRDLARVFLGRDLQCAQCHDHPLVDDFRQIDYHGLLAFVSGGSLAEVTYKDADDKDQKVQLYAERAAADAPFESVFERGVLLRTGTRLAEQIETFDDYYRPDQRYLDTPPADALTGAAVPPKASRRARLAERLTDRNSRVFVSNWSNRLWALAFGRGLVHPVDMTEPGNPPTNPELLKTISEGLLRFDMRMKPFLRQLVMTDAYRRGSDPGLLQQAVSTDDAETTELRAQLEQQIAAVSEQIELLDAAEQESLQAYETLREAWLKVQGERTAVCAELDAAEAVMMDANKKHVEADTALAAAQKKLSDSQSRIALLVEAAVKLEQALSLLGTEDPEVLQAIGVIKNRAEAARAKAPELEKVAGDAQIAVNAAATVLQETTASVDQVVRKLVAVQESLAVADATTVTARASWSQARSSVVLARRERSRSERLIEWFDAREQQRSIAESIGRVEQRIAVAETESVAMNAAVKRTEGVLATTEQSLQTANEQLTRAAQACEQQLRELARLEHARSSIADAATLVGKADPFLAAQESLGNEIAARQSQAVDAQATVDATSANVAACSEALSSDRAELDALLAEGERLGLQLVKLQDEREAQQNQLNELQSEINVLNGSISSDAEIQNACNEILPLTAEPMCWSTLRVTGVLDAYIRTELGELEKQSPMPPDADDATKAERQQQAVRQAIEKLRGIADQYVSLYASGPDKTQDDFFASADQALYVANGGSVFSWAGPSNNNPTQVATGLSDPSEIARVLYWSYLCRQPTDDETAYVAEQLAAAGEQRNTIIHEMAWSLLASSEFRFVR